MTSLLKVTFIGIDDKLVIESIGDEIITDGKVVYLIVNIDEAGVLLPVESLAAFSGILTVISPTAMGFNLNVPSEVVGTNLENLEKLLFPHNHDPTSVALW